MRISPIFLLIVLISGSPLLSVLPAQQSQPGQQAQAQFDPPRQKKIGTRSAPPSLHSQKPDPEEQELRADRKRNLKLALIFAGVTAVVYPITKAIFGSITGWLPLGIVTAPLGMVIACSVVVWVLSLKICHRKRKRKKGLKGRKALKMQG